MNYTLVLGVDRKHLEQLALVWPTWCRHKPSMCCQPIVVFYDREQVHPHEITQILDVGTRNNSVKTVPWPYEGVTYPEGTDKWTNQQRYRMLSGFVHVPPYHVDTKYWLKVDVDTVATGDDDWVDPSWFDDEPAIVSHPWGYTKPAAQMMDLDQWVAKNADKLPELFVRPPLNLLPKPNSSLVRHKRIISWTAFFHTGFTRSCSDAARVVCGPGLMPVPSQDGFLFFCAKRLGLTIRRQNMKSLGWEHWSTMKNIKQAVKESLNA